MLQFVFGGSFQEVTMHELNKLFAGMAIGAPRAVIRYFHNGMREIHLYPNLSLIDRQKPWRANAGTSWTMHWPINIPVGVTAYPWFVSTEALTNATPFMLTWYAWWTAFLDPLVGIAQGKFKNVPYLLFTLLLVSMVILIVQPTLMMLHKFRS